MADVTGGVPGVGGNTRKSSTGRQMLAAAMLGLAEVLEGKKREDPAIVETSVGGDGDPIDLVLDPDDPRLTVAFVKPWLRRKK